MQYTAVMIPHGSVQDLLLVLTLAEINLRTYNQILELNVHETSIEVVSLNSYSNLLVADLHQSS